MVRILNFFLFPRDALERLKEAAMKSEVHLKCADVLVKLEAPEQAVEECTKAIECNSKTEKAYVR